MPDGLVVDVETTQAKGRTALGAAGAHVRFVVGVDLHRLSTCPDWHSRQRLAQKGMPPDLQSVLEAFGHKTVHPRSRREYASGIRGRISFTCHDPIPGARSPGRARFTRTR